MKKTFLKDFISSLVRRISQLRKFSDSIKIELNTFTSMTQGYEHDLRLKLNQQVNISKAIEQSPDVSFK